MTVDLTIRLGRVALKNPVICGAGEHVVSAAGIRAALAAGAAAVVVKSTNESEAARTQLRRADYALFDSRWRPLPLDFDAPAEASLACRSGLSQLAFDDWLHMIATLDDEARSHDAYVVASLVRADLDAAVDMARRIEAAGFRILEFNVGTPYGDEAAGAVATERAPDSLRRQVAALREAVAMPLWVKVSGQSERVDALASAARDGGADAVSLVGRFLGMLPDLETRRPVLDTNLGFGGYWNLPLTCYWLARARAGVGADYPLIGMNGVRGGEDVARILLAGGRAAQMSSVVMTNGYGALTSAITELEAYLARSGAAAGHIVGAAADATARYEDLPEQPDNWRKVAPPTDRK